MSYDRVWKPTKSEAPHFICIKCKSDDVWYRIWESPDGAHTDYHYNCHGCNRDWWVEGE